MESKTLADFEGFAELDPEKALKMINTQKDILTPMVKAQNDRLQGHDCPFCGQPVEIKLHPKPFVGGKPLPRYIGRCAHCKVDGILIDG